MRRLTCECGAVVGTEELVEEFDGVHIGKVYRRKYNDSAARNGRFLIPIPRTDKVYCIECAKKLGLM